MNKDTKVWIIHNGHRNITADMAELSRWSICLKTEKLATDALACWYVQGCPDAKPEDIARIKMAKEYYDADGQRFCVRESTAGRCGYDGRRKVAFTDTGIGYQFASR